tara:strand:- start:464 stop:1090 length:627 start_codon:yes stop_codon:yes gene_type:complete
MAEGVEISSFKNEGKKRSRRKDVFELRNCQVRQDLCGMKVGTDALLLFGYTALCTCPRQQSIQDRVWNGIPFDPSLEMIDTDGQGSKDESGSSGVRKRRRTERDGGRDGKCAEEENTIMIPTERDESDVGGFLIEDLPVSPVSTKVGNDIPRELKILDVGCGSGILSLLAADCYPSASVHSIDINEDAIEQTRENVRMYRKYVLIYCE